MADITHISYSHMEWYIKIEFHVRRHYINITISWTFLVLENFYLTRNIFSSKVNPSLTNRENLFFVKDWDILWNEPSKLALDQFLFLWYIGVDPSIMVLEALYITHGRIWLEHLPVESHTCMMSAFWPYFRRFIMYSHCLLGHPVT